MARQKWRTSAVFGGTPLAHGIEHAVEHSLGKSVASASTLAIELVLALVVGLVLIGIGATGLPSKVAGMFAKRAK